MIPMSLQRTLPVLVILGLLAVPNAAAKPEDPQCFQDCDWLVNLAKDTADKLIGPSDRGDTCDGWPNLVAKFLDECPHGPMI